jgi:predicted  nucleic acid-binding Zn-ribbon protein
MSHIQQLYRLQQVDTEISAKKTRLKEVIQLQREPERLRAARERAAKALATLRENQALLEDLNLEVGGVNAKAKRSEQRLYSGKVTNPKELADLENELAALGRRRAVLEDEILEAMIVVEDAQSENANAADALVTMEAEWKQAQSDLQGEQNELALALHGLLGRRQEMAGTVPGKMLADYEALKARKNGLAVVALEEHRCMGCHVRLPENKVAQAERGEWVTCSGCGRILNPIIS